jgi:hypothetical protein
VIREEKIERLSVERSEYRHWEEGKEFLVESRVGFILGTFGKRKVFISYLNPHFIFLI